MKEGSSYKLSEPAKRMVRVIPERYSELSVRMCSGISASPEKKGLLKKKIRDQHFATDKKNLMDIAGLDEKC